MNGFAAETASRFLTDYAYDVRRLASDKQADHVLWVRDQMRKEFLTLRAERDHARDLACRYEAEIAAGRVVSGEAAQGDTRG